MTPEAGQRWDATTTARRAPLAVVCAWCGAQVRPGATPASHGMCDRCAEGFWTEATHGAGRRVPVVDDQEPGRSIGQVAVLLALLTLVLVALMVAMR